MVGEATKVVVKFRRQLALGSGALKNAAGLVASRERGGAREAASRGFVECRCVRASGSLRLGCTGCFKSNGRGTQRHQKRNRVDQTCLGSSTSRAGTTLVCSGPTEKFFVADETERWSQAF